MNFFAPTAKCAEFCASPLIQHHQKVVARLLTDADKGAFVSMPQDQLILIT